MTQSATAIPADTWVDLTWDEYVQLVDSPGYEKAACYYHNGKGRIEMTPLGSNHSRDHFTVGYGVNLFASLEDIDIDVHDNCTYRKVGYNPHSARQYVVRCNSGKPDQNRVRNKR